MLEFRFGIYLLENSVFPMSLLAAKTMVFGKPPSLTSPPPNFSPHTGGLEATSLDCRSNGGARNFLADGLA